jgi:hypothetical protein
VSAFDEWLEALTCIERIVMVCREISTQESLFAGLVKLCGLCELLARKSASSEGIRPYRACPSITSAVNSSAQPQLMVMPAPPCP